MSFSACDNTADRFVLYSQINSNDLLFGVIRGILIFNHTIAEKNTNISNWLLFFAILLDDQIYFYWIWSRPDHSYISPHNTQRMINPISAIGKSLNLLNKKCLHFIRTGSVNTTFDIVFMTYFSTRYEIFLYGFPGGGYFIFIYNYFYLRFKVI